MARSGPCRGPAGDFGDAGTTLAGLMATHTGAKGARGARGMGRPPEHELSRRERQIMDVLYARGESSVAEVTAGLPEPPSPTAVRTMLRILEEKGHITSRKEGVRNVYQPTRPRARAGRSALRRVVNTFYGDSVEQAMAAYLSDPRARISADELDRLAKLIDEARAKGD